MAATLDFQLRRVVCLYGWSGYARGKVIEIELIFINCYKRHEMREAKIVNNEIRKIFTYEMFHITSSSSIYCILGRQLVI